VTGIPVRVRQGSPEWLAYRRTVITGTDLPVLLGISPWRCEADLAAEKLNGTQVESTLRMRIGTALEDLAASEYEAVTGKRVRRHRAMVQHPDIPWAAASPDAQVIGERRLVEFKRTGSRTRFADGIPQDVQAQVAWQLGCVGMDVADIAVLTDDALTVYEQPADPALFADLVAVAADFRRRLEAGGPFARSEERIRRDHPADDGTEIEADADTAEAVRALLDIRAHIARMETDEKRLKAAIEARMGDAAVMTGPGFRVVWKRTKDRTEQDWRAIAEEALAPLAETERAALVGRHVIVRAGMRPLRVTSDKVAS
jgi:putative phage-type endonuclease